MKKESILKILGFCVVFLLSATLTFFVVKKLDNKSVSDVSSVAQNVQERPSQSKGSATPQPNKEEKNIPAEVGDTSRSENSNSVGVAPNDTPIDNSLDKFKDKDNDNQGNVEKNVVILKAYPPVYANNKYSFTAYFTGEVTDPYHYELWSSTKLVAKSTNGKFVNIPAISGGKYKLCLVSDKTRKNITDPITVKGFDIVNEQESEKPVTVTKEVVVLKASAPLYANSKYSFTASFTGNVTDYYHYELWSTKLIAKSEDGKFVNIPGISGGKYKLRLVSDVTGKNLADPITVRGFDLVKEPKKLISEADFQKRMLDSTDRTLNGGKKSFVTKSFRLTVVNAHSDEGDFGVSDIQDVRDMIHTYNKWKSARVVELEYDSQGYVTHAKIEPVY